jgi:hypothetical protein
MPNLLGIEGDGPSLAADLLTVFLVILWLALIRWTYSDARLRFERRGRVRLATTAATLLPIVGTVVYMIVRPQESLEDARERELSIKSSKALIQILGEMQERQREMHGSVQRLEQALIASRRRAAVRHAEQTQAAPVPQRSERP